MSIGRLLAILILLPFSAMLFLQVLGAAAMVNVTTNILTLVQGNSVDLDDDSLDIVGHVDSRDRPKRGYVALRRFHDLDGLRQVAFESHVPIRALLKDGEQLPDREYWDLMIKSRAAALAEGDCDVLLRTIASDCAVRSASASIVDESIVKFYARLDFVQADPFGTIDRQKPLRYIEVREDLSASTGNPEDDLAGREQIYLKAKAFCDRLRESEGNCSLASVSINRSRHHSGISGTALFSLMQPRQADQAVN